MPGRMIRLTVEADMYLFILITSMSSHNLINFGWIPVVIGPCTVMEGTNDRTAVPDLRGGLKGETLGLNGETNLRVGKGSYKDWPASLRVETIISASSRPFPRAGVYPRDTSTSGGRYRAPFPHKWTREPVIESRESVKTLEDRSSDRVKTREDKWSLCHSSWHTDH